MGKYVEKGRFNSKKWIADNTVPVNERVRFKNRPYDYQLNYVANDLFKKDYKRLNISQQDDVLDKLDDYMDIVESVNEGANDGRLKMSSGTYKRMDGLHNVSKMKSAMKSLVDIQKELFEEGFERDEIVEFLEKKIYHNVTVRMM